MPRVVLHDNGLGAGQPKWFKAHGAASVHPLGPQVVDYVLTQMTLGAPLTAQRPFLLVDKETELVRDIKLYQSQLEALQGTSTTTRALARFLGHLKFYLQGIQAWRNPT